MLNGVSLVLPDQGKNNFCNLIKIKMKDLKYLLLLICFVIIAHATKNRNAGKNEAKLLPDIPDYKEQKTDSSRTEASTRQMIVPVDYNFHNYWRLFASGQ